MHDICAVYTVKSIAPSDYYLGNDYKKDKRGRWYVGSQKYLTETIKRVEKMFGELKQFTTHPQKRVIIPN